jgi:hypothetical protein
MALFGRRGAKGQLPPLRRRHRLGGVKNRGGTLRLGGVENRRGVGLQNNVGNVTMAYHACFLRETGYLL